MGKDDRRYRFNVPITDTSVNDWVLAQNNLSFSLRMLIRDYIRENGLTDVTCVEVTQGKRRGRPPKTEYDYEDLNDTVVESAPVVKQPSASIPPVRQAQPQAAPVPVQPVSQQTVMPQTVMPQQPVMNPIDAMMGVGNTQATKIERDVDGNVNPDAFFN